jgi:hypothetical protein
MRDVIMAFYGKWQVRWTKALRQRVNADRVGLRESDNCL